MKCFHCEKVALYISSGKGFCKSHFKEGCDEEGRKRLRQRDWAAKNGFGSYQHLERSAVPT